MTIVYVGYTQLNAAENMAADSWMFEQVRPDLPILYRSYGWVGDAFTFGYTQKLLEVWEYLEGLNASASQLCRRPTAGGIVDHRRDWTYAIACHVMHPWAQLPPIAIYRTCHEILMGALLQAGASVELYVPTDNEASPKACFERPSPFDVLHSETGVKVAGAALKRNRLGVLIQGSVSRDRLHGVDFSAMDLLMLKQIVKCTEDPLGSNEVRNFVLPHPIPGSELYASNTWLQKR